MDIYLLHLLAMIYFLSNFDENWISETVDPVIYTLLCQLLQVDTFYEKKNRKAQKLSISFS